MTKDVAGLFEVSVVKVVDALTAHAKTQGIGVTRARVLQLLLDEIAAGTLNATVLAREVSGKMDTEGTTLDPRVFLDHGHVWLIAHGLHSAQEADNTDYPDFPSMEADFAISNWIESRLSELRYLLLTTYEINDLKPYRVGLTVAAMLSNEVALPAELANEIKATQLKMRTDAEIGSQELAPQQKERESMLKLVIGMAIAGYRYNPASKRNSAIIDIARDLSALGVGLDEDTVRKYIKEGATLIEKK